MVIFTKGSLYGMWFSASRILSLIAGAVIGYAVATSNGDSTAASLPSASERSVTTAAGCCVQIATKAELLALAAHNQAVAVAAEKSGKKPNICIIWGDDIGQSNLSAYSMGLMGYRTPNIDRIAREGMIFTDYYGEQSCTAGRSSFITGQHGLRTGLTKVGLPGATLGLQKEDPTIAELLKPLGYATGQFGKNHLGDRNEFLPTVHGFDEFYGNLYHLNAEEEPELPDYPKDPAFKAEVRSARSAGLQGYRRGRPDGRSAVRQGRQTNDPGHRAAHEEADGDDR